jgi:translation initiation factor 3 subunit C
LYILSPESEDEQRVVRSEKDRAWENIFERVLKIRSAMKINDWNLIHEEFEDVNKQIDKSKMLIMKHGLPGFYVKMLMDVEDFVKVTLANKEAVAKMKPVISRALNRMKLVARRHNLRYEAEIARCREHPEEFRDPESAGSKKKKASSDSSDSSSDSDSDSESSSSSSGSSSSSESDSEESSSGSSSDSSEVRASLVYKLGLCMYASTFEWLARLKAKPILR